MFIFLVNIKYMYHNKCKEMLSLAMNSGKISMCEESSSYEPHLRVDCCVHLVSSPNCHSMLPAFHETD